MHHHSCAFTHGCTSQKCLKISPLTPQSPIPRYSQTSKSLGLRLASPIPTAVLAHYLMVDGHPPPCESSPRTEAQKPTPRRQATCPSFHLPQRVAAPTAAIQIRRARSRPRVRTRGAAAGAESRRARPSALTTLIMDRRRAGAAEAGSSTQHPRPGAGGRAGRGGVRRGTSWTGRGEEGGELDGAG